MLFTLDKTIIAFVKQVSVRVFPFCQLIDAMRC